MNKYIVLNKNTKLFLISTYYRNLKDGCKKIEDAHKFSAFELKLASQTALRNKENYIVYNYESIKNEDATGLLNGLCK